MVIKLLIVDADENSAYKQNITQHIGDEYDITIALNGATALKIVNKNIDCIIIDYMLPDMSGHDVARQVIANYLFMPIIILINQDSKEVGIKDKDVNTGIINYITKKEINKNYTILSKYIVSTINRVNNKKISEEISKVAFLANKKLQENIELTNKINYLNTMFLANISHEIRTPLNSIIGINELLQTTMLDKEQKSYCNVLEQNSNTLLELVDNAVNLANIESGKIEINLVQTDLSQVIRDICKNFEYIANSKQISLIQDINLPAKQLYELDIVKIDQILSNLISNAIKFCDKDYVRVSVFANKDIDNQDNIVIIVEDNGIGIKNTSQIFDSFTQINQSKNGSYRSNRMGLSICQKLVNFINGSIECKSKLGIGSKFILNIPTKIIQNMVEHKIKDVHVLDKRVKLLVCEDFIHNKFVLEALLNKLDIAFDLVSNGIEALEIIKKNNYDLILMDCMMPHKDGYETTKILRKEGFNKPIIAMTAFAMSENRQKCIDAGMDDFILKPITITQLVETINKNTNSSHKKLSQTANSDKQSYLNEETDNAKLSNNSDNDIVSNNIQIIEQNSDFFINDLTFMAETIARNIKEPIKILSNLSADLLQENIHLKNKHMLGSLTKIKQYSEMIDKKLFALTEYLSLKPLTSLKSSSDLIDVLNQIIQNKIEKYSLKPQTISIKFATHYIILKISRLRLLRMLDIIFDNIINFKNSSINRLKINIDCELDQKFCYITIIDNNLPIRKEHHATVCYLFNMTNYIKYDTGNDLAVALKISKLHDGDIKINSTSSGNKFIIKLPIRENQSVGI